MTDTAHILVDLLGFSAGVLTTLSMLPQVIQTWRTRSAADLNLKTFLMLATGLLLWLLYGVCLGAWPLIVANGVGFALAATVVWFKLRYGAGRGDA